MPRKRVSDSIDHIPPSTSASKRSKHQPSEPANPPDGKPNLPSNLTNASPYDIFILFFDDTILQTFVDHTNQYASLYPAPAHKRYARSWFPTSVDELRAYIGAYIYMSRNPFTPIESHWNTQGMRGPLYPPITRHIAVTRWQQINRFFHIAKPLPTDSANQPLNPTATKRNAPRKSTSKKSTPKEDGQESVFQKLEPLNEHLRSKFNEYWSAGSEVGVCQRIQFILGREETATRWVLANRGYVLDWPYHAKGDESSQGPQDLVDSFTDDHRAPVKDWKVLWRFLLDLTIINSLLIYRSVIKTPYSSKRKSIPEIEFRRELALALFERSQRHGKPPVARKTLSQLVHKAAPSDHGIFPTRLSEKAMTCKACRTAGRKSESNSPKRKPLEQLSENTVKVKYKGRKRPEQVARTRYGCKLCNMHLCRNKRCWNEHLAARG